MNGDDLRTERQAMGLTQAELAEALGVTENTITRWEGGTMNIANPTMLALALSALSAPRKWRKARRK